MICAKINAQDITNEKERQIEQIMESLGESDEGENSPQTLEDLVKLSENPLNINTATSEEFEQLHLLDLNQIAEILNYRERYGYFLSPYELRALKTLTPEKIKALEPFLIFVSPEESYKNKNIRQQIIMRAKTTLPKAKGFDSVSEDKPAAYPGFPVSYYSRYNFEIPNKIELGFSVDQDAGEEFFKGSNKSGFDYYSGFLSFRSKSFIREITIGDYCLKFGQGLNYWSGSAIGKSTNVINLVKTGQGIRPHTSTDENLFFRGIAATLGKGALTATLFYSDKKRDANLSVDKASGDTVFTSLQTDGYHRTKSEKEDEKSVSEQNFGIYSEFKTHRFSFGALLSHQTFSLDMITGTSAYKAKSFSGNENTNAGLDYRLVFNKIQLFGEAAMSMNQKTAFIQGMIWHLHPQINVSLFYRCFDPGFHSFYGNPLSEGSEARNEKGFYNGIEIYPLAGVKISGYADFYHFPFLTYSTLAPSSGKDLLGQIEFTPSNKLYFYIKGKFETKPQKYTKEKESFDYNETVNKIRIHEEWKILNWLLLKNRFEWADYSFYKIKEKGYLAYQDLDFTLGRWMDLTFRYAYFNTDGYNSRIYTYENDLLYSFSFPEFHGKGHRMYLNLKWRLWENLTLYFKAGRTVHSGVQTWGSGNDLTQGNYRTELKTELYLKF